MAAQTLVKKASKKLRQVKKKQTGKGKATKQATKCAGKSKGVKTKPKKKQTGRGLGARTAGRTLTGIKGTTGRVTTRKKQKKTDQLGTYFT